MARESQCESGLFARIDSRESIRRKKPMFTTCERFARIASNLRFATFSPLIPGALKCDSQKGSETIHENQAMRANL